LDIILRSQLSDVDTSAERVGNILTQLYIEPSRSTDVVHVPERSQPASNFQTVSLAEDEAVQALLSEDNRMVSIISGASESRSSPPFVQAKAPVSEDMVSILKRRFSD
jgi:hypothetical protein